MYNSGVDPAENLTMAAQDRCQDFLRVGAISCLRLHFVRFEGQYDSNIGR